MTDNQSDGRLPFDGRSLGSSTGEPSAPLLQNVSPLERFKVAKDRVSTLFFNVSRLMGDATSRLFRHTEAEGTSDDLRAVVQKARLSLESNDERLKNAHEKVKSNQMKVAFFGRTSNGKSTAINALLRERILPSGIGHTTSCFCCVQGTAEDKPYLQLPDSSTRSDVEVSQMTFLPFATLSIFEMMTSTKQSKFEMTTSSKQTE